MIVFLDQNADELYRKYVDIFAYRLNVFSFVDHKETDIYPSSSYPKILVQPLELKSTRHHQKEKVECLCYLCSTTLLETHMRSKAEHIFAAIFQKSPMKLLDNDTRKHRFDVFDIFPLYTQNPSTHDVMHLS